MEGTGKNYKRYLEPPRSREYTRTLVLAIRNRESPKFDPTLVSPVPPVKLYLWHLDNAHRARINEIQVQRIQAADQSDG